MASSLLLRSTLVLAAAAFVVFVSGCREMLIVTPYTMRTPAAAALYDNLDPALKTPDMPVLYVTDREPIEPDGRGLKYGFGRSPTLAFGQAVVSMSPEPTWDDLVTMSTTGDRDENAHMRVSKVTEIGRFSPMVDLLEVRDGRLSRKTAASDSLNDQMEQFHDLLRTHLARTDRKEVLIFVHGFNNDFDYAALRIGQAWHFGGRRGVPIVFSWPAGSGGLLGYAYDRESGEYATLHLKLLLLAVASCPEVERIHLVSHSRGTDVAVTALREVNAELRGLIGITLFGSLLPERAIDMPKDGSIPGPMVWELLKLETLVLAAPDLDLDVFIQRYFGENLIRAANRTVIYFSGKDEALSLSNWLFGSRRRIGAMMVEDFKPEARAKLAGLKQLELIDCDVSGFSSTHSYILQHPSAMSDLLILLDQGAPAGSPARPLKSACEGVWRLDNDYLKPGVRPRPDLAPVATPPGAVPSFMD